MTQCYVVDMNRRQDRQTALVIDAAIGTASTHGVQVAAIVLSEQGIRHSTVLGVLTAPKQRRSPGQRPTLSPCSTPQIQDSANQTTD
jgi:hypothetical protein